MTKLTPAQTRALEAVRAGHVYRVYGRSGNVIKGPPGIGARSLWALERLNLICEVRGTGRARDYSTRVPLIERSSLSRA